MSYFVKKYQRHIDIEAGSAGSGSTAPSDEFVGTAFGKTYKSDSEHSLIAFEVPTDWDGISDMTLTVYWAPLTAIADTESVKWDITYRVKATNIGETIDGGSTTLATNTYTQSGAGTAKEFITTDITLTYDDVDNPLNPEDKVMIQFDRDISGDTFGGDATVFEWHIKLNSNTMPEN